MLARQCEPVHRRYTADQETAPIPPLLTRVAGKPPVRSGFSQNPTPPVGLYGENSSGVRGRVGGAGAPPYSATSGAPRLMVYQRCKNGKWLQGDSL